MLGDETTLLPKLPHSPLVAIPCMFLRKQLVWVNFNRYIGAHLGKPLAFCLLITNPWQIGATSVPQRVMSKSSF